MDWGAGAAVPPAGRYRVRAPERDPGATPIRVDLTIAPTWAAMTAGPLVSSPPDGAAIAARLLANGFTIERDGGTWFRSWSSPLEAATIQAAARAAFGVGADDRLDLERRPSYEGDPRAPIGIVLGALYIAYALVAGWVVLTFWDTVLSSRAHPASATWAQLVAPAIAIALFVAYVTIIPRWRLARAAAHRPPARQEVDLEMPLLTPVGLALPPVVLIVLLLLTA